MQETQGWLGLNGRTVVITGAGGGIGRAMATSFALAGANVALLDRREADAHATAKEVKAVAAKVKLATIACDVSNPSSVAEAAEASLEALGPCDVLVNNAGIMGPATLDTLSLSDWNSLLAVNLTGCLLCAQTFAKQMRTIGKGALVHVSSIAGSQPQPASGAYSVSKAGIIMLSRQLAIEWGPFGIRSNAVCPGLVETPMTKTFYETPGVRQTRSERVPLRRIAAPQDIADATLFLASDRASYITGEEILVDGGYGRMIMGMIPRPGYD